MTDDGEPQGGQDAHLATLGRLTRGALHEIANPLLALLGSAELGLADAEPGTKVHGRIELVRQTGNEIAEIVRALQAYARTASAPVERLSLADAAGTAAALVRRVSAVRDVELAVRAHGDPFVEASPGIVQQRLVELLLDAIGSAERGDTVELVVSESGGDGVASVGAAELRLAAA